MDFLCIFLVANAKVASVLTIIAQAGLGSLGCQWLKKKAMKKAKWALPLINIGITFGGAALSHWSSCSL